ncbi:MAG: glycosyltransferase [Actinobacteria bacterium]|uniref:Unannotated protein n=1 Tax=freshwater metagenome TaxID=449393 RepID=A0A6J5ZEC0_9ZZZZ|nr:glycosyltransferase [Actinomycetota bacterium]
MKVLVVAEFYPRRDDPVLGIWAHRQAQAAIAAGAEVRVVVLHRVVPPASTPLLRRLPAAISLANHPKRSQLDGVTVDYVRYASPPKSRSYATWGGWAAKPLARALKRIGSDFKFDLVHAHNAVPAADAAIKAGISAPLVVSEHGADVFYTAAKSQEGRDAVRAAFGRASLVIANSEGIAEQCASLGAAEIDVVHLGTSLPAQRQPKPQHPTLVTVAHLASRKRHGDVLRALWVLRDKHPQLRYLIIGDGPERQALEQLADQLGLLGRVEFAGQLDHGEAQERARGCSLFVMPSVDEAFGVAYIEAMAGWLPAIGSVGEAGPTEIRRYGEGMRIVPPADIERLAERLDEMLASPALLADLGLKARATIERSFSWEACGAATIAAYERALGQ